MNFFIRQFGKPKGAMGRMLSRVMTVSNKKMHKAVLSQLGEFSQLLEIGFGSGSQLDMISKKFPHKRLFGIDISQEMLERAGQRLGSKAKLSLCDCSKTNFADEQFDVVISTDVCYFWQDPQAVLEEIKRITKPSGRLIIAYNSMYARSVHKADATLGMYDDASIKMSVENAGMHIISRKKCGSKQTVFVVSTK
ncbi:MAG: class I SAM-dependent methyltransferase [Ruminococcus sp.]|nr:class I SAM-dependent methyltransferase [Ruminococcus sp.]